MLKSIILGHLTWFVNKEDFPDNLGIPELFSGLNIQNMGLISVAVLVLGVAIFLDWFFRRKKYFLGLEKRLRKLAHFNPLVLRVFLGISLITAYLSKEIFGPDFPYAETENLFAWMGWAELLTGIILLSGLLPQIGALLGIMLFGVFFATGSLDWVFFLNYGYLLGAFLYVLLKSGEDRFSLQPEKLKAVLRKWFKGVSIYAFPIFRITAGISLVSVGFYEKLMNPWFGLTFLSEHNFNFIRLLGFNFSDEYFLYCAALVEILVGIIFILGILPRLTSLVLFLLFMTTFVLLGPKELLGGHLVYIGLILMMWTGGAGSYKRT